MPTVHLHANDVTPFLSRPTVAKGDDPFGIIYKRNNNAETRARTRAAFPRGKMSQGGARVLFLLFPTVVVSAVIVARARKLAARPDLNAIAEMQYVGSTASSAAGRANLCAM